MLNSYRAISTIVAFEVKLVQVSGWWETASAIWALVLVICHAFWTRIKYQLTCCYSRNLYRTQFSVLKMRLDPKIQFICYFLVTHLPWQYNLNLSKGSCVSSSVKSIRIGFAIIVYMDYPSSFFWDTSRKSVQNFDRCIFACRPPDTLKCFTIKIIMKCLQLTYFTAEYCPSTVM